jgi:7-keto-8-aminopelargonate synthetase-like enzyme
MYGSVGEQLRAAIEEIRAAGLYKSERQLASPQSAHVLSAGQEVLNFCANNYLGLADHPDVVAAAKQALDDWGFGMASVRFICGTQTQHTLLESRLSEFLGTEATILYSSCFDANGGVFEVLLDESDAVISDELVAASAEQREVLRRNTALFRARMEDEGFDVLPGEHPIVPVMFGDAALAGRVAETMLAHGVYVIAFSYPVVPQGRARIRVQLSAAHSAADVETCVQAFVASRAAHANAT